MYEYGKDEYVNTDTTTYRPNGTNNHGQMSGGGSVRRSPQDIKSIVIPTTDRSRCSVLADEASLAGPYSPQSALLATPPRIPTPRIVARLATLPNQLYAATDIHLIMNCYQYYSAQLGVDWVLAFAQCLVETDQLRSWWVQRPRRNPARLGVTGETRLSVPADIQQWAQAANGTWHKGLSFLSWDRAVLAHLSHLLCYAVTDDEMTPAQLELSIQLPCKHLIPPSYYGRAKQVIDLNGRWSVPGTIYAQMIVETANRLVEDPGPGV